MKSPSRDNRSLAQATFITNVGDYLSFFAILTLVHKSSGSVLIAAYSWPIKSLGMALGGLTLPAAMSWIQAQTLIVTSQWISALISLSIAAAATLLPTVPVPLLLASFLLLNVFQRYFEGARESYSKSLGSTEVQRELAAEILHGFYGAQVVGPLVALGLIYFVSPTVPLWVDAASFLSAGALCLQLPQIALPKRLSVLRPLQYLSLKSGLGQIFLLRSVGYWVPVGIWNYLIFSVISEHYGLTLIHSAWTYAAVGAGSVVASALLKAKARVPAWLLCVRSTSDAKLAFWALSVLALTRVAFLKLPSLPVALLVILVGGVCNGVNAVATQSLRRKFTTASQFPEVLGLETVIGKLTDWGVATGVVVLMTRAGLTFNEGVWISSTLTLVLAWLHLSRPLRI